MPTTLEQTLESASRTEQLEKQRRFISAYWLRPENAFWMYLRSEALSLVPMRGPVADLGCGDGVFSFLHADGVFSTDFDVFGAVAQLEAVRSEAADIFDHVDDDYSPEIVSAPAFRLDVGTDLKSNLLGKAERLGLYNRLVPCDHNKPLPFDDDSFETVYCNTAYWVDHVAEFLSEVSRVTRSGGTVVLQVKLDAIADYTMQEHGSVLGDRWLGLMNRGRIECWPTVCDRLTWESRFDAAGLEIVGEMPIATRTHAHIWDIGLRPIAPMLIKVMNAIHPHLRTEIKRDWVDLFAELLRPFCDTTIDLFDEVSEPAELQYVLTPR